MSDQTWYVYQNGQQLGPFAGPQIKQMVDSKMIPQDAYLFKVGWKDWRPIEECFEEVGIDAGTAPPTAPERREAAPRATVSGRVVVHNNGQLVIGGGVNISASGIFVETKDQLFSVGERLKLSVRCEGFTRPFNVVAQVVRYNSDPKLPVGYGLKFEDLDEQVGKEIQSAVDAQNRARGQDKLAK
jgi:hypothetical protein